MTEHKNILRIDKHNSFKKKKEATFAAGVIYVGIVFFYTLNLIYVADSRYMSDICKYCTRFTYGLRTL